MGTNTWLVAPPRKLCSTGTWLVTPPHRFARWWLGRQPHLANLLDGDLVGSRLADLLVGDLVGRSARRLARRGPGLIIRLRAYLGYLFLGTPQVLFLKLL